MNTTDRKYIKINGCQFKRIAGAPNYAVNEYGHVINLVDNSFAKIIKSKPMEGSGLSYKKVCIKNSEGKNIQVYQHILVAKTFIPNPHRRTLIKHLDNNHNNNHKDNIKWVTANKN